MSRKFYYIYRAPKGRKLVENAKCKSFVTAITQFSIKIYRSFPVPQYYHCDQTSAGALLFIQCHYIKTSDILLWWNNITCQDLRNNFENNGINRN
jgi:hypothetical protein